MHDAGIYGIILKCLRGLARMHLISKGSVGQ